MTYLGFESASAGAPLTDLGAPQQLRPQRGPQPCISTSGHKEGTTNNHGQLQPSGTCIKCGRPFKA